MEYREVLQDSMDEDYEEVELPHEHEAFPSLDQGNEEVEFPHEQEAFPSYSLLYSKNYTYDAQYPFNEKHSSAVYSAFSFPNVDTGRRDKNKTLSPSYSNT